MSIDQERPVSLGQGTIDVRGTERTAGLRGDSYDVIFTGDSTAAIHTQPLQAQRRMRPSGQRERETLVPTAEARAAFRVHWTAAQNAADAMVFSAETKDHMSLAIAADDLDQSLAELWNMRD